MFIIVESNFMKISATFFLIFTSISLDCLQDKLSYFIKKTKFINLHGKQCYLLTTLLQIVWALFRFQYQKERKKGCKHKTKSIVIFVIGQASI